MRVFASAAELAGGGRGRARGQRLGRGHAGAHRPLRRGDRRPAVDPHRPERARRESPYRGDGRARLSHPLDAAGLHLRRDPARRRPPERELRLEPGALPGAGAGRLAPARPHPPLAAEPLAGGGVRATLASAGCAARAESAGTWDVVKVTAGEGAVRVAVGVLAVLAGLGAGFYVGQLRDDATRAPETGPTAVDRARGEAIEASSETARALRGHDPATPVPAQQGPDDANELSPEERRDIGVFRRASASVVQHHQRGACGVTSSPWTSSRSRRAPAPGSFWDRRGPRRHQLPRDRGGQSRSR